MNRSSEKSPSPALCVVGRVGDVLENILLLVGGVFLVLFFLSVVLDVSARTLNSSLVWTQDAAIFSYVWCIFTTAAVCIRRNEHFSIDLFHHLPKAVKTIQQILIIVVLAIFALFMVRYGWEYAMLGLSRKSSSSGFRLFYAIIGIPLSNVATLYFLLEQVLCMIFGIKLSDISKNAKKWMNQSKEPG